MHILKIYLSLYLCPSHKKRVICKIAIKIADKLLLEQRLQKNGVQKCKTQTKHKLKPNLNEELYF